MVLWERIIRNRTAE